MPVRISLDAILSARGMTAKALAQRIGISETQLSHFRSGKVKGVRFSTVAKLCWVLDCAPGDLLQYDRDADDMVVVQSDD